MMESVPAVYLQGMQHMLPPQPQTPPAASDACLTIVHSLMCHRQVCATFHYMQILHLLFGRKNLFLFQTINLISCYSISPMLFLELKSLPRPSNPLLIIANTGTLPWTVHAV